MEVPEEAAIPATCFTGDVSKDLTRAETSAKVAVNSLKEITGPDEIPTQLPEKLGCVKAEPLSSS